MSREGKTGVILGCVGIALGMLAFVGPGQRVHALFDTWWDDHNEYNVPPWSQHHPNLCELGLLFAAGSAIVVAGCWVADRRTAR